MIALVTTGGTQYKVTEGEVLTIERIPSEIGSMVDLETLFVSDDEGKDVKIGTPIVPGAKVTAKVIDHGRNEKIQVIKFKAKVRYKRNVGHRQENTSVKIEKISA